MCLTQFMEEIILYGIPNCEMTKRAIAWLKQNNISFTFHDYKQVGISKEKIKKWDDKLGWKNFFNKRSTTWRALTKKEQNTIKNLSAATKIMVENNSIIKRPIIECKNDLIIGFDEIDYKRAFL